MSISLNTAAPAGDSTGTPALSTAARAEDGTGFRMVEALPRRGAGGLSRDRGSHRGTTEAVRKSGPEKWPVYSACRGDFEPPKCRPRLTLSRASNGGWVGGTSTLLNGCGIKELKALPAWSRCREAAFGVLIIAGRDQRNAPGRCPLAVRSSRAPEKTCGPPGPLVAYQVTATVMKCSQCG